MLKSEFEKRIKVLLPDVTEEALDAWSQYVQEIDSEGIEPESDLWDSTFVELSLIKAHQGIDIATKLFNCGERFTFNYFELRGAASKLVDGWTLDEIAQYTLENGCDSTLEESEESKAALWEFKRSGQETFEMQML